MLALSRISSFGKNATFGITVIFSIWMISSFWGRVFGNNLFLLHWFLKNIFDYSFKGVNIGCCLPAIPLALQEIWEYINRGGYATQDINTSSTAQGDGGSFKNRKPIGEIGCCGLGMAERIYWWTERCLRSPLFLSLFLTIYPPTNLYSMYLFIDRSIYLSLYPSIYLSNLPIYLSFFLIHLSIYLSFYLSIHPSIYLSICLFVYLSIYLYLFLSIYRSIYLFICLSVYLFVCLSVELSICGAVSFSVMYVCNVCM